MPDDDGVDAVAVFYRRTRRRERGVEAELRERASTLPHYQRPRWLHPVAALPRTPTGKLLRRKLAELVADAGMTIVTSPSGGQRLLRIEHFGHVLARHDGAPARQCAER